MSCLTSSDVIFKTPSEVRNLNMDFSLLLEEGVTISNPSISISPTGVTSSNESAVDGIVYFTLSGGTSGVNYTVVVSVETSDSQTITGSGNLKVRD